MNPMILPTKAPFLSLSEASQIAQLHKREGTPVCLTTGCFDVLHIGHLKLIQYAATYGVLFVGINTDIAIRKLKGESRPINGLEERAEMLASLRFVNAVFPIDSTRVDGAIKAISPAYWIKGGGYTMDTLDKGEVQTANEAGAKIVLYNSPHEISTTSILSRL